MAGTAHVHNGVLLDTRFAKGKTYTMKISGEVDVRDALLPASKTTAANTLARRISARCA